jgi:uncharacterized protein YbaP (TraB family)
MLFRVTGSPVFIADSIHALPKSSEILPAPLWTAQRDATWVFFETDLDRPPSVPQAAMLNEQTSLQSLIPAETYESALVLWHQFGIGLNLESLKPWFAGLVLANCLGSSLGFDAKYGVDRQIWDATEPAKRSVLEGTEALLAFDRAPASEQSDYLAMIAKTPEIITDRLQRLARYWRSADAGGFEQELSIAKGAFPIMFNGLIDERNKAWLPAVVNLVEQQTASLILVGALHLVGESSLLALLANNGHVVERV